MSVWSIGSLEEQKKKEGALLPMGSLEAPQAVQQSNSPGLGASIGGAVAGHIATTAATTALTPVLGPLAPIVGKVIGGFAGSAISGGGGSTPTAQAPDFNGGDLVNKQQDTSVTIPTQVARAPLSLNQEATNRAFNEEEYMKKFGGYNYGVQQTS